jgi:hypothetical protein
VFAPEDIFEQDALVDFLGPPGPNDLKNVERLKGVFRLGAEWILFDRAQGEISVTPIAYRRDSRLEIILPESEAVDWNGIETKLISLLSPRT